MSGRRGGMGGGPTRSTSSCVRTAQSRGRAFSSSDDGRTRSPLEIRSSGQVYRSQKPPSLGHNLPVERQVEHVSRSPSRLVFVWPLQSGHSCSSSKHLSHFIAGPPAHRTPWSRRHSSCRYGPAASPPHRAQFMTIVQQPSLPSCRGTRPSVTTDLPEDGDGDNFPR